MNDGWKKVGTLPVDAGCIMLMDPCYTESHDDHRAGGAWNSGWYTEQIVNRCHENGGRWHEVAGRETGPNSGIVVESGFGDGVVPRIRSLQRRGFVGQAYCRSQSCFHR